jgi:hypothetical protein
MNPVYFSFLPLITSPVYLQNRSKCGRKKNGVLFYGLPQDPFWLPRMFAGSRPISKTVELTAHVVSSLPLSKSIPSYVDGKL